jgi:hypothetical protein
MDTSSQSDEILKQGTQNTILHYSDVLLLECNQHN